MLSPLTAVSFNDDDSVDDAVDDAVPPLVPLIRGRSISTSTSTVPTFVSLTTGQSKRATSAQAQLNRREDAQQKEIIRLAHKVGTVVLEALNQGRIAEYMGKTFLLARKILEICCSNGVLLVTRVAHTACSARLNSWKRQKVLELNELIKDGMRRLSLERSWNIQQKVDETE